MRRHIVLPMFVALSLCVLNGQAAAATVELDAGDISKGAAIHADAPRLSWAGNARGNGHFDAGNLPITSKTSALLRYDLSRIPDDMKIISARWTLPTRASSGVKLHVWRILAEWGPGVCHRYRTTQPEPVPWHTPGAGAIGIDRTIQPTGAIQVDEESEKVVVNVTRDVAMWHSGAQPNHGWLLSVEQDEAHVTVESPLHRGADAWVLRVTYEPK
ncbi:MAG: hypothetical protein ACOC9P_00145 [bacterium]